MEGERELREDFWWRLSGFCTEVSGGDGVDFAQELRREPRGFLVERLVTHGQTLAVGIRLYGGGSHGFDER